jgi:transcriptional regulator with XRE-family HTH domain
VLDQTDLGAFLRARREALSPADVGLRDSGRRRTPGLRREEVAALAGVSIDYLVRLEQGRDTRPSPSVISALSDALLLDEDARHHLGLLAMINNGPELCPSVPDSARVVPATVTALLERLDPTPAVVLTPYGDLLAANDAMRALGAPLGLFDRPQPNVAWFTFLDPRAREVFPDLDTMAHQQVSDLRAARLRWGQDPRLVALVEELQASPAFAELWSSHALSARTRAELRVVHPDLGPLHVAVETMTVSDGSDQRLVTWLPADDATAAAFAGLAGGDPAETPVSPAVLRVVS